MTGNIERLQTGVFVERSATNDIYTIVLRVSEQLMNDPAVNIVSFYQHNLTQRLESARKLASDFAVGDRLSLTIEVTA